jgi:CcmD family protein
VICYNAAVILPATATGTTSGAMTLSTAGAPAPSPAAGMRPGVPQAPVDHYGYFFAAYGVVWLALLLYVYVLANRVRALEK